jgi:CBS domain-containing protein
MTTVNDLLQIKGNQIWSIGPEETIEAALRLMAEKHIGALLVMEAGKIMGIFSERDFARYMVSVSDISLETPVKAIMTHPVFFISPTQTIEDCMKLMTAKHVRHLPVLESDQLVGLISIGDVVKQLISEKETEIKKLEKYILGSEFIS